METHDQQVRSVYYQFLGLGMVLLVLCWMFSLVTSLDQSGSSRLSEEVHWVMS